MTSEIDKLKHFHVEDYSGIYFTDELNNGEEFLYTTIGIKDDKEVTFIYIDCVEVEISPDNWIMAVDKDNTDLLLCSVKYNIKWKECSCLKGIRLEDVTVELEEEAYEEIRHNI